MTLNEEQNNFQYFKFLFVQLSYVYFLLLIALSQYFFFSNKPNFIYYRHFKVMSDIILELMKMYTKLLKKHIKAKNVNLGRRPCFWKFELKINSPAKLKSVCNNFFLKFHVCIITGFHRFLLFIISELLWLSGKRVISYFTFFMGWNSELSFF